MANLSPEWEQDQPTAVDLDDSLEVDDLGAITDDDSLVNSKGASLNYVKWASMDLGAFCADKSSFKG